MAKGGGAEVAPTKRGKGMKIMAIARRLRSAIMARKELSDHLTQLVSSAS
jgi:hypothetical protein